MATKSATHTAKHVFISYVAEDKVRVDKLCRVLEAADIPYWRDRKQLGPGEEWKRTVRQAIHSGAMVFLACFSDRSRAKQKSYMNEELNLAIAEYRLRAPGKTWLIPVRFDAGEVPDWDLGADRTLHDLNHVDLFGKAYTENAIKLVEAINAVMDVSNPDATTIRAAVEEAATEPATLKAADKEVSKEHATQLREAARRWSDEFSSFIDPEWSVHIARLSKPDSDEGLRALRAHFPNLNRHYSKWRAKNISMRSVETKPWLIVSGRGDMPTTAEGKVAVKEHNDLVHSIIADLGQIDVETSITGQCEQCRES